MPFADGKQGKTKIFGALKNHEENKIKLEVDLDVGTIKVSVNDKDHGFIA